MAGDSANRLLLPGQDRRHTAQQCCYPESPLPGNSASCSAQACDTPYDATLVRAAVLSSLVLGNRNELYNLFFETAWASLRAKIEKDLGIQAAGVAVLHTWNQRLEHHPHVHMMVPGSGPSLDGTRWVEQGEIELQEVGYIADLIGELRMQDWVVFIEGPPKPECPPSQMLKYLTRYLTGGPISNRRIVGERNGRIYFKARSKLKGEGQVEVSLPCAELVQQWCLHILPKDFTKTRHFGAWSGTKRRRYLEQATALAPQETIAATESIGPAKDQATTQATDSASKSRRCCPHCQATMACILKEERPSWRELFYGEDHPSWFEWTSRGMDVAADTSVEEQAEAETSSRERDIFDEIIASKIE